MQALANVDAERTVLGCALVEAECLYRVLPILRADNFSLDSNRRIFHAISLLAEAGKPVDVMTVSDELAAKSHLQAIGGVAYLASLTDTLSGGLARTMNVEHYAEQVRDKSRRRQAHAAAEHLMAATEDPSLETSECLHRIGESLLQIEADSGKTTARPIRELIPQALHELERQAANDGLVGLPTGLDSLDLGTGGIREGEMWTVGALTGRGKTAFAAQVLLANGRAGKPVCIVLAGDARA